MKKKILLIDDEEILIKRVSKLLSGPDIEIGTAFNGEEGLVQILSEKWDLIICDINMPKLNGIEVIKKAREKGCNYTFVFFTGHGNQELMLESLKYGAYAFVDKPQFSGLKEIVFQSLNQKQLAV